MLYLLLPVYFFTFFISGGLSSEQVEPLVAAVVSHLRTALANGDEVIVLQCTTSCEIMAGSIEAAQLMVTEKYNLTALTMQVLDNAGNDKYLAVSFFFFNCFFFIIFFFFLIKIGFSLVFSYFYYLYSFLCLSKIDQERKKKTSIVSLALFNCCHLYLSHYLFVVSNLFFLFFLLLV